MSCEDCKILPLKTLETLADRRKYLRAISASGVYSEREMARLGSANVDKLRDVEKRVNLVFQLSHRPLNVGRHEHNLLVAYLTWFAKYALWYTLQYVVLSIVGALVCKFRPRAWSVQTPLFK